MFTLRDFIVLSVALVIFTGSCKKPDTSDTKTDTPVVIPPVVIAPPAVYPGYTLFGMMNLMVLQ